MLTKSQKYFLSGAMHCSFFKLILSQTQNISYEITNAVRYNKYVLQISNVYLHGNDVIDYITSKLVS